jgi:hypothetical protein
VHRQRSSHVADPFARPVTRGDAAKDWLSLLLPSLTIVGVLAAMWLIYQAAITPYPTLAPISPQSYAIAFSATPVSSTSPQSPEPLRVIVMTPDPTPTPFPVGWQTATAEARLTATATFSPQPCPTTKEGLAALPIGTMCKQPTATPIPAITSTPILGCDPAHWLPGEVCIVGGPFAPTPTPAGSPDGN